MIDTLKLQGKELSVLYVEDDPTLLDMVGSLLEKFFGQVSRAKDGIEALEIFNRYHEIHQHTYDIVITDITMPRMDGVRLARTLLETFPKQHIIILSAQQEVHSLFELINIGVDSFISKPVTADALIKTLSKTVSHIHDVKALAQSMATIQEINDELAQKNKTLSDLNAKLDTQVAQEQAYSSSMIMLLEQYKKAIDQVLIVSKTDLKGRITYTNANFINLTGYSHQELRGKTHKIIRHPDMPNSLFQNLWDTLKLKRIWHGQMKNRSKDGRAHYVQTTIFPIMDESGDVYEYMALREDVTKLVEHQETLHKERNRINMIMDNQNSIVILVNVQEGESVITHMNKPFFDTFAYDNIFDFRSRHQCICELFVVQEGYLKPSTKTMHWTQALIQAPNHMHQAIMVNKEGHERIYTVALKGFMQNEGQHYIVTFTDITEIEALRQKAEEAQRIKSLFLANMSHEIRTPINGIQGFTYLLKQTPLDGEQSRYLSLIDTSLETLVSTVNEVLDFSKIENNKMQISLEEIDFITQLRTFLAVFEAKAHTLGVRFEIDIHSGIAPYMAVDWLHLKQIVSNLLSNALKFTPSGGTVSFVMALERSLSNRQVIYFAVEDTGVGIDPSRQDEIFNPFAQGDSSTTRKFGGTGLGLSICKSLVEMLGGTLSLQSTLGVGSIFSFTLELTPVAPLERAPSATPKTIVEKQLKHAHTLKVLIVEDYDVNQVLLQVLLQKWGVKSVLANDGQEAVEFAQKTAFDIILMDINMPRLNGIDATQEILRTVAVKPTIIGLSANTNHEDINKALESGMKAYLPKPIIPAELFSILASFTGVEEALVPSSVKPKVFPFQKALMQLGLDEGIVASLVEKYIKSTKTLIEALTTAHAAQDYPAIRELAHKLKGSSSTLGFDTMTEHAKMLSTLSQACDREGLSQLLATQLETLSQIEAMSTAWHNDTGLFYAI